MTESFGERLRYLRQERHITQEKFAMELEKLGCKTIKKSAISQYEHNKRKPDMKSLIKIADFFDVTMDYLIRGSKCDECENQLLANFRVLGIEHKNMVAAYSKALVDCTIK